MSIESRLAAFNYVKFVYATGTGLGTLNDAVRDRNWALLVDQGQRTTRTKTTSYTFTAEDIEVACRTANSWSLLATGAGLFFAHLNGSDDQLSPILLVQNDGSVASLPSRTLVHGTPGGISDAGDIAASVAKISQDQLWTISVTQDSGLAFRHNGQLQMTVLADGRTWSLGNNGFFAQGSAGELDAGAELRKVWPPYSQEANYNDWRFAITYGGYFILSKDGDAKLALKPDGAIWSAGAGGWVRTRAGNVPSAPAFSPALIAAAGAISIAGEAYSVAADWMVPAAGDIANWFQGAAGSVADGFNVGVDWAGTTVEDAKQFLSTTGETIQHGAEEVVHALDPTGW